MGFQNPLQARLRRDLKAQHQPGLPRHSHTLFCPSVVPNTMILLSMILPKWSVERRESSVESFCHFSPSPSLFHVPPQPRSAQADLSRRSRKARRRIPRFQHFRLQLFLVRRPDFWKNIICPPSTAFSLQKNSSRDQITQIPQRRIRRAFRDFRPF